MPEGGGAAGSGVPGHRRVWISVDVDVFYRSDTALYYGVDWGRGVQVSSNAVPATVTNASIVYVNGLGGGQVRLLEETYAMNDPLLMADEVLLSGQGKSSSTFLDGDGLADGEHLIVISGDTNCGIRDLQLQTADGGGNTSHCIFIEDGSNNFYIENVIIVDSDSDGIHVEGTNILGGHIHNCGILDVDDIGISVNMDAANYMDYFHVNNSVITDCGQNGLSLADCRYSEVSGNIIDQNGQDGIELNLTVDTLVQNNIIYLNTQHGVSLVNADRNTVEGNLCHSNDSGNTATYDGINVDGDSTENLIEGNYSYLNKRYGIMTSGLRTQVNDNHVILNGLDGILIEAGDCQINDNYIYMTGQTQAATYHGIKINASDADNCQICDNWINDDGSNTEDGIHLVDGVSQCHITGNYIRNLMGDGIDLVANNNDNHIENNYLVFNDDYGVRIRAATCSNNFVKNNHYNGNITGQISDGGTDTALHEYFGEVTDPDYVLENVHPVIRLPDGANTKINIQWLAPREFQELVRAVGIFVADSAGNMDYWDMAQFGKICLEPWDMHYASTAEDVVAFAYAGSFECVDFTGAISGIAQGDLAGIALGRGGANAADTINDDVYFFGIKVEYV